MATRRIAVVSAGLSKPSSTRLLADRLASATVRQLAERDIDVQVDVFELRDYAHDITNNLLTGFAPPALESMINTVVSADAVIAVTPIFNASYSGLFKLFFDVVEKDGLAEMPTLLAATGGSARHSLAIDHAMRPLFAYLYAAVVATGVYAAAEDWGRAGIPADAGLVERIDRAVAELAGAVAARVPATARDPFLDPVPFEDLLNAGTNGDRPA